MKMHNIKSKMIVRYVGNGMHVLLFHLVGAFYFLRAKLLDYLQKYCNNNTSFKTSLIRDLQNNSITLQLGLLGKVLAGPWMKVLYGNKSNSTNLGTVHVLKKSFEQLKVARENPMSVLNMQEDLFAQALHPADEKILEYLQRPSDPQRNLNRFCQSFSRISKGSGATATTVLNWRTIFTYVRNVGSWQINSCSQHLQRTNFSG